MQKINTFLKISNAIFSVLKRVFPKNCYCRTFMNYFTEQKTSVKNEAVKNNKILKFSILNPIFYYHIKRRKIYTHFSKLNLFKYLSKQASNNTSSISQQKTNINERTCKIFNFIVEMYCEFCILKVEGYQNFNFITFL